MITLIARSGNAWASDLLNALLQTKSIHECALAETAGLCGRAGEPTINYVYVPSLAGRDGMMPDLSEAEQVFQQVARLRPRKLVLLSSALIYGAGTARKNMVTEDYVVPGRGKNRICNQWKLLEEMAGRLPGNVPCTILRATTVLPSPALLSQRLMRRLVFTLPGHDPTLQLLSLEDLANAIRCAIEPDHTGVFNVAPDRVVPLHACVRIAGNYRIPVLRTLQRLVQRSEALDYLRYSWTVSNKKIKAELGYVPRTSSAGTVLKCWNRDRADASPERTFDEFGMDMDYIEFYGKTLFKFLCNTYWRIEVKGLEHVPGQGPGILVGMHRGFMPWDAVMTLHLLVQKTGRVPRFLTHPGLLKFPFISNFVTKLGGVVACQQSAGRVLESGELLGVFPEGVQGAFTPYRKAYKLLEFGRNDFVKMALRHRVPIVSYVTVGSAEVFPIFGQIKSRRLTRYSDWPCLPISTFPILPVPLPSKWHIQFLPPIHPHEQHPPEAAHNAAVVKAISLEVRTKMQHAVDEMVCK